MGEVPDDGPADVRPGALHRDRVSPVPVVGHAVEVPRPGGLFRGQVRAGLADGLVVDVRALVCADVGDGVDAAGDGAAQGGVVLEIGLRDIAQSSRILPPTLLVEHTAVHPVALGPLKYKAKPLT